jgi:diguanylate cyclase (GGDEF)-like protein/PAS domain S-box-containing protein
MSTAGVAADLRIADLERLLRHELAGPLLRCLRLVRISPSAPIVSAERKAGNRPPYGRWIMAQGDTGAAQVGSAMTQEGLNTPNSLVEPTIEAPTVVQSTAGDVIDFAHLFAAMPHPYLIVRADANFTILAVNDRYLTATNTQRDRIIGHSLFEVFPDNPKDTSASGVSDLRTSLQRVIRDRIPDVMGVQKYDVPRRDGTDEFSVKYWSPLNTPIIGKDGSVSLIIHQAEDVTDLVLSRARLSGQAELREKVEESVGQIDAEVTEVLRRANELKDANRQIKAREAKLTEFNERLQDLNRAKSDFFSNVSHEFRTPLTLILGPLEQLLRQPSQTFAPKIQASLEMTYRNAQRLLTLVNTLLEFSRLETQRAEPNWQRTDLSRLTRGLASTFQSLCEQAGLTLHIDCPSLGELVQIDREMWERILLNLLSNAFKFTFEGRIEVRLRSSEGRIELTVMDTGTGISATELPKLFERFHRIRAARGRTYEGSGIGLALVKELVGLLGGSIHVDSTEGRGTCFLVRVPFKPASPQDESSQSEERGRNITTPRINKLTRQFLEEARRWLPDQGEQSANSPLVPPDSRARILVVDDNADMRGYIRRLLEEEGYSVQTAGDGRSAVRICQVSADRPKLVLADVMMPGVTGFEIVARLRADGRTADLPIILLSARAAEEFRVEGARSGADDYVMKPFHARELIARVEAVLHRTAERKRAEARLRQAAAVFTGTNEAVIIMDAQRRIVAVNESFTRITGFTPEEVLGNDPTVQQSGHQDAAFYDKLWETLDQTGYWQGEIWNRRKSGETYPVWENISAVKDDNGALASYVAVFSDIGSMKAAQERLTHIAHHDALTDLPNRLLFEARLEQSLAHSQRHRQHVGVLVLDLDHFKLVNDTLGHPAGDRLLQCVAARLKQDMRAEDTVARLGGDEFAIVLDELARAGDAAVVAEKILERIAAPLLVDSRELVTSASIGISIYPEDAQDGEQLVRAADSAMYRAKQRGRHAFEFYTPRLHTPAGR